MKITYVSDDLKALMVKNQQVIKGAFHTERLFVDSAVRDKLRGMGVDGGRDEVLSHRKRLIKTEKIQAEKRKAIRSRARQRKLAQEAKKALHEQAQNNATESDS